MIGPMASPQTRPWITLLFLTTLSSAVPSPYSDHCRSTVPESTLVAGSFSDADASASFNLSTGYFFGGALLFRPDLAHPSPPSSFHFRLRSLRRTRTPGVLHVAGNLTLTDNGYQTIYWSVPRLREVVTFVLSGFWSDSTGKLCMVGPGFSPSNSGTPATFSAVFKLNYPKISNISTRLVTGTLHSLDVANNSTHFDPISVLTYMQNNYQYTKLQLAKESCSHLDTRQESLAFNSKASCSYLREQLEGKFLQLEYRSDCSGWHCGPFAKSLGLYPTLLTLNQIQCSGDGRFQMYMSFPNLTNYAYSHFLMPELSLVGEGFWDPKGNRLCLAACRIAQAKDSLADISVSDCTIGFSLWFPAVLSIKKRSTTVGRIWSNRRKSDSAYFSTISIHSSDTYVDTTHGLKYEYTEMETVGKFCLKSSNTTNSGKGIYPDGKSFYGMRFGLTVRNAGDNGGWVSAVPLFVGETIYRKPYANGSTASMSPPTVEVLNQSLLNVSYHIDYTLPNSFPRTTEIAAEGIYDPGTGVLCMVGCHNPNSSHLTEKVKGLDSLDCAILINIHLAPSNPDNEESTYNGTIMSIRAKSDPLYFEPLVVSSFSSFHILRAAVSFGRMHLEIAIILFSLALSCSLICVQLFHVKQHSDVLPSVSIRKLVILTVGHMIPLVLNFLALFLMNHLRKNGLLWTDGWLEVIVVVVRIMIMVAFLLHIRFLQVAWRARPAEEAKKGLWVAERSSQILLGIIFFWGLHCMLWSFEVI